MSISRWLDRVFYRSYGDNWDDSFFRDRVIPAVKDAACVLDLGAGAGIVAQMNFRGIARKMIGIDLDPRVKDNSFLDEAIVGDVARLPLADASCEVVLADNVLEHLSEPGEVFSEVSRVLSPGGKFFIKTPNRFHYVALIAGLTPLWFHRFYNSWRGRKSVDTFRTLYRANSAHDLEDLAAGAGLRVVKIERIEGRPEYLRKWPPLYLCGLIYERLVNSVALFAGLRVLIIGEFMKPAETLSCDRGRATEET